MTIYRLPPAVLWTNNEDGVLRWGRVGNDAYQAVNGPTLSVGELLALNPTDEDPTPDLFAHTPRPWQTDGAGVYDADGDELFRVQVGPLSNALAELIVAAVNAHDEPAENGVTS